MFTSLQIALLVMFAASLMLVAAAVARLWIQGRSQSSELARLSAELIRHRDGLVASPTPAPLPDREAKAVFIPSRRRDNPESAGPKKPVLIAVPDLAPPIPKSVEFPAELVQRFGAIWELADSGAPIEAIARASGHPIGQIELILGLRRTRDAESRG